MQSKDCYEDADGPLNQGDILIAPMTRVIASDRFVPDRWDRLDQIEQQIDRSEFGEPAIHTVVGWALVMVTSHDYHHDKEWNAERKRLIRAGVDPKEASRIVDKDDDLDRTFQASPLIPLEDFNPGSRGNYRAGRVVGYYPLPSPPDSSFPECLVDLTYRCTIDRKAISERRWCLTPFARDRLRYAIARFDSFRTIEVAELIEAAVGRSIVDVNVDTSGSLSVELLLDDESVLRLVRPPVDPEPGGRIHL
ncbi:hypothetical protein [Candidatus Poriferisocius sp.]|uniref:hypothetical protein n=1 Tax=Candidatus Poriferisocius sp. TaxID=3101276 RepID=UPI003B01E0AB